MGGWWALVLAMLTTVPAAPAADEPAAPSRPQLAVSGAPRIGYVDGHVLRFPDGGTLQLPRRWGVTGIATYDGGYLVSDDRVFEGTLGMAKLDADGKVLETWAGTGAPLVSRDGHLAWVSLVVAETGRTGPTLLHADSLEGGHEITQRIGRKWMPFLTAWWRGNLVYETWGRSSSFLTDLSSPPRPIPRAEDRGTLSPHGHLTALTTREGVEIRQDDGQLIDVVRDRHLTRTQTGSVAWEDDHHLLATYVRGKRMCVVRIDDRGRLTRATDWQRADTAGFAFLGS